MSLLPDFPPPPKTIVVKPKETLEVANVKIDIENTNEHEENEEEKGELENNQGEEEEKEKECVTFALPVPKIPDIIPHILPAGQVHLFSGASGAGKTALTFQLLASMHKESAFFGLHARKPAFIGYVAADRTWDSHAIWLASVGLTELPHYSLIQDLSTSGHAIRKNKFGDRFQLFRRCIAQMCITQGFAPEGSSVNNALAKLPFDSFLVVDPISLFIGGDLNKYDQVYSHMLDLNQFCILHSCTLLGIAHAGKQKSDPAQRYTRPQDRIVGTTAQTGCAGTVFHLSPPSETGEEWSELAYVPHHAASSGFQLTRNSHGLFIPVSSATPSKAATVTEQRKVHHAEKILPFIPSDCSPVHYKLIIESATDTSQSQVYRYLAVLEQAGEIERASGLPGMWKRKQKN